MSDFKLFRVIDTGEIVSYPAHFEDHPVFGLNIEPFEDECEVDKVVTGGHELPVDQRVSRFVPSEDYVEDEDSDDETNNEEESD